jgi:hypothetical protein
VSAAPPLKVFKSQCPLHINYFEGGKISNNCAMLPSLYFSHNCQSAAMANAEVGGMSYFTRFCFCGDMYIFEKHMKLQKRPFLSVLENNIPLMLRSM